MKLIKIFSLFTIIFPSCLSNLTCQVKEPKLVLNSELRGSYSFNDNDSSFYFLVDVNILNHSDSICKFMAFNCLTGANLIIVSKKVKSVPNICASNYPVIIEIKPNQVFFIPVILKMGIKDISVTNPIKIGFVLFPPEEFKEGPFTEVLRKMKTDKRNIIWGEPLNLYVAGGKHYNIK